jgi:hypothetical protein
VALALLASGSGGVGAWYWLRASRILPSPLWAKLGLMEPFSRHEANADWTVGIIEAASASATLNKKAAIWTGVAVGLGAFGNLAGAWPIWPCSN